ncbi:LPS assembly lipoprotein LptE [Massilia agilis]|uniref:LPS-assembly lipoprotein LptE n=1 Tax=Massilia agilis TaxID=1811226 RepID=A0ABT2DH50_9BURK|nr:LPS assembly lipoprotein LptE [Massilia agilis]MCS0810642.1 LPS assembly lipoprotein LptE [Massilia agilis]
MNAARLPFARLFTALFIVALLAGCGFKLRGSNGTYNMPFHSIYVGFPDTSPLGTELKRNLRAADSVVIADKPEGADAQLVVMSEARGRQILSLNNLGRVREYLLTYTFTFRVTDAKGAQLLGPTEIRLSRNMAFSEQEVLAKEAEANLLYRDMQSDLVQQILRRLAAMKPAAPAASPAPAAS